MMTSSPLRRPSRSALLAFLFALPLAGCSSLSDYGEAPGLETGYPGIPVDASGWYGQDVASVAAFQVPLARYGRWDSHPGYGRVFVPLGVGAGWQPYRDGYWAVDPRYGRRWVSSEPFGWATYHYGRWARDPRLGWFWVPDTRYGPGWVSWREGSGYSGWAPLPPIGWERWGVGYNPWGYDSWLFAPSPYLYRPGLPSHIVRGKPHYDRTRPAERPGWAHSNPGPVTPDPQTPPQWTAGEPPPAWKGQRQRQARDGTTRPGYAWRGSEEAPVPVRRAEVAPLPGSTRPPPHSVQRSPAPTPGVQVAPPHPAEPRPTIVAATVAAPAQAAPSSPARATRAEPRTSVRGERQRVQPE